MVSTELKITTLSVILKLLFAKTAATVATDKRNVTAESYTITQLHF